VESLGKPLAGMPYHVVDGIPVAFHQQMATQLCRQPGRRGHGSRPAAPGSRSARGRRGDRGRAQDLADRSIRPQAGATTRVRLNVERRPTQGAAGDGQAIWLVDREGRTAPVPSVSITRGAAEFTLPLGNLAEHVAEADGVPLTAQPWERGWGYGTSPGVWVVDRSRVQSQWAWRVTRSASVIWLLLRRRS
jgi:hypothetical protein